MDEDDDAREFEALYRRCAAHRMRFQQAALQSVPVPKVLEHAARLGLAVHGGELAQVPEGDLHYAFDLAVHSAPPGRSRAIDRIAHRQARSAEGEAALVLRALETAWFSVFRVVGRHRLAGLVVQDALLGGEVWLVDDGLTETAEEGGVIAARVGRVRGFAITCGVVAGLDEMVLAGFRKVFAEAGVAPAEMTADPHFATMIYQRALGLIGGS